jgi:hypothetical protein
MKLKYSSGLTIKASRCIREIEAALRKGGFRLAPEEGAGFLLIREATEPGADGDFLEATEVGS